MEEIHVSKYHAMQTTKFLVVIGAVAAVWASPLPSFAGPDTEAQAKMREALRQKLETLNPPATTAPAPAPKAAAPAPARKVEQPKPAAVAPAAAAPTVVVPVPLEVEPAKPAAVTATATAARSDSRFSEVPVADSDATAEKMREALRQKIATEPAPAPAVVAATAAPAKPVAPAAPAVAPAPAPAATSAVASPVKPEPVVAPAFTGSKQDRLTALLQQYKADQITPQQYHTQRAAIVAEP